MPIPPGARSSAPGAWTNTSKTRGSISALIPTPESFTRSTAWPTPVSRLTSIRPPALVYFTALERRFATICSKRSRSPRTITAPSASASTSSTPWICAARSNPWSARCTTARRSMDSSCRAILPRVTRDTSSRSSTSRERCRSCRLTTARSRVNLSPACRSISSAAVKIAASGLRSSCPSMARNWSRSRTELSRAVSRSRTWYWRRRARSAARTALRSVRTRAGRSSSVTLAACSPEVSRLPKMISGRSDQGGCLPSSSESRPAAAGKSASSVSTAAPAPSAIRSQSCAMSKHAKASSPPARRARSASCPSRPTGARTRMRSPVTRHRKDERDPGEHALHVGEARSHVHTARIHAELADVHCVLSQPPLQHRDGLAHFTLRLEKAQQNHGVGEEAHIDRRAHRSDHPGLRQRQDGEHAALPEIGEQLVELDDEELLLGHRREKAVQAVDDEDARAASFHLFAHPIHHLTRRHLGRIDLLDAQLGGRDHLRYPHPQRFRARRERVDALVEGVDGGGLAASRGGRRILRGQHRLARAGGTDEERAGPAIEAAAQEGVQLRDPAGDGLGGKRLVVLRRDQPREHPNAATLDAEVVIAATEIDAPHLDDP